MTLSLLGEAQGRGRFVLKRCPCSVLAYLTGLMCCLGGGE